MAETKDSLISCDPENQPSGCTLESLWLVGACAAIVLLAPHTLFAETSGIHPDRVLTLLDRDGSGHLVRWTAETIEDGGTFVLYRGNRLDQLELTLSETAVRGLETYSVNDIAPAWPYLVYQLRYVRQSGHEVVLATVAVTLQRLDLGFPGSEPSPKTGKALVRLEREGFGKFRFTCASIEGGLPWTTAPSPEVPPPRPVGVRDRGTSAAETGVGS